ncbi:MAG: transporter substrate-binding domain-containing protein [Pseudomonadota bacterium]
MKKTLAAAIGLVMAAGAAQAQMSGATVRIATEGAYPPFNMIAADGSLTGFDVEIANALCAEIAANCEIVTQDWDGIIHGLVANKYDAIIASMSITAERKQTVDFTGRYYSNYLRIIAEKGSGIGGADDLSGRAIGAQRATVAAQWAEDTLGRRSDVRLYDTQTAAYSDLKAGRLDALVSDVYPAHDWLQGEPNYEFVGERIDIDDLIGIAVRKADPKLRDALDAAILRIRENGVYAEINAKYFPFDIY